MEINKSKKEIILREAGKCFERIQKEAAENGTLIPFRYFLDGNDLFCEITGINPSCFATWNEKTQNYTAFFEK